MIKFYKKESWHFTEIPQLESGAWINIYPPFNQQSIEALSEQLNIFTDFFTDSLDIDEKSRYDYDDNNKYIVVKTPIPNNGLTDDTSAYITIPVGIIIHPEHIITISPFENPVIDSFINASQKKLPSNEPLLFVLSIMARCVFYYLHYLKEINNKRNEIEKEVLKSDINSELKELLDIQKSLVYFVTAIRSNELLMMKMQRTNFLQTNDKEEYKDMLDDIIIDASQALEMSNIYTNIINNSAQTYSSIISNNLNAVMKRLTSITIILMIPTLVASFWGMNVFVPLHNNNIAFYIIIMLSFIVSFALGWWFQRKKLF